MECRKKPRFAREHILLVKGVVALVLVGHLQPQQILALDVVLQGRQFLHAGSRAWEAILAIAIF